MKEGVYFVATLTMLQNVNFLKIAQFWSFILYFIAVLKDLKKNTFSPHSIVTDTLEIISFFFFLQKLASPDLIKWITSLFSEKIDLVFSFRATIKHKMTVLRGQKIKNFFLHSMSKHKTKHGSYLFIATIKSCISNIETNNQISLVATERVMDEIWWIQYSQVLITEKKRMMKVQLKIFWFRYVLFWKLSPSFFPMLFS